MTVTFDDSRLERRELPPQAEQTLRHLASTGARIRADSAGLESWASAAAATLDRPRGVLVVGSESRLVRSVLEPQCPVPMVAWPFNRLPAWVGPLDLVVALDARPDAGPEQRSQSCLEAVAEARRRGAVVLLAAEQDSASWHAAGDRSSVRLPMSSGDPMAAAIAVLAVLGAVGIGPEVVPEQVARTADLIAESASPHRDLSSNPAKDMACALADAEPLLWGGSVLAARASRRFAESLRRASGRAALSADAEALMPVIGASAPKDPFADPEVDGSAARPVLVVMDDGDPDPNRLRARLEAACQLHDVAVRTIGLPLGTQEEGPVGRYVALLLQGRFAAAYLGLGLGRFDGEETAGEY